MLGAPMAEARASKQWFRAVMTGRRSEGNARAKQHPGPTQHGGWDCKGQFKTKFKRGGTQ